MNDEEDLGAIYKVRVSLDPEADVPDDGFCWNLEKVCIYVIYREKVKLFSAIYKCNLFKPFVCIMVKITLHF